MQAARSASQPEDAVSRSELAFRRLLEKLPAAAYTCDREGLITFFNSRAVQVWGREPILRNPVDRFCGSFRLFWPDGSPMSHGRCWMARTLQENREYNGQELVIERPDGTRLTVLAHASPLHDEAGQLTGAVNVLVDITDRKQVERQCQEAREIAEAANKAKDDFLAALSHELRTPLTPALLAVAALERDAQIPDEIREQLHLIRRNVELEARLIDDLLDLTRIIQGKLELNVEAVDAHAKIRYVVEICRSDIEAKNLNLALELGASKPGLHADAARLQQVIWNLLKNAAKFTPEGGRITIATEDAGADQLRIRVSDTGVGLAPESLQRIFEAFEQGGRGVTRRFGGLGLGLAIARSLVEAHGGTITAQSAGLGRGATFTVLLPGATTLAEVVAEQSSKPEAINHGKPLRILLVEDHEDTARQLSRLLQLSGYQVTVAGTVEAALAASSSSSPFDLLLSDMGLPDGSGIDLIRRLGPVPAIALTGYGMEADVKQSREAGFLAHLTKPIDPNRLEATIRQVSEQIKAT